MYRSVNDVSKTTRPDLRRYEWRLIEKEITWNEYNKEANLQAWGYLIQAELLESLRISRERKSRTGFANVSGITEKQE